MSTHLTITDDLVIPDAELQERAAGSGGPGGQHANKTDSRVILRWSVRDSAVLGPGQRARILRLLRHRLNKEGELVVQADDTRSWHQNRAIARERLATMLREALRRRKHRRPTRPTRASKRRRLKKKRRRSELKSLRGRVRRRDD